MRVQHNASDDLLMRYATGSLGEGAALVVESHLDFSRDSRCRLERFEALGGQMIDEAPIEAMSQGSLAALFACIDAGDRAPIVPPVPRRVSLPELPEGMRVPRALAAAGAGNWRFLGPGIRYARVNTREVGQNVILLKVAAGKRMPAHTHEGEELTCVLYGAFADESGRYGPGDLEEADSDMDHEPKAGPESPCICLISVEGRLRIHSLLGRLAAPLVGM